MIKADKMFEYLGFKKYANYDHPLIEYTHEFAYIYFDYQDEGVNIHLQKEYTNTAVMQSVIYMKRKELGWLDD